jgi:UDP-N-acetyl-2-amino-2-deoxyglucuronate dehydrogenase
MGLRIGADVICEKPIVLNPWNVDALAEIEKETGKNIYCILQLRLHPSIIALREKVKKGDPGKVYDVKLNYITSRGKWYHASWKGSQEKSGGIATNIGVHFFDMLMWIFGDVKESNVETHTEDTAKGKLLLENANVDWRLSINENSLPEAVKNSGKKTFRTLQIDGEEFEFSEGFTDLHTQSYQNIFDGAGFRLADTRKAIELVYQIRTQKI